MANKKQTAPAVIWKEGVGPDNYSRAQQKRAGKGETAYRAYIVRQVETYRGEAPTGLSEPQIDEIVEAFEEMFGREKTGGKVQTLPLSGQVKSD